MKTSIGGDRLGSGNKQEVSFRNYERSTHDMGYTWRSSMAAGTLVPFMSELALPGDSWDIELNADVVTLPTIGPLFGSYKVQLDIFEVPMRLYNAKLHMNKLGIGMDMANVFLPQIRLFANNHPDYERTFDDNEQMNPSCLLKYLGISGLGTITGEADPASREFNAIPLLAYYDIFKNYYSNKQEEKAYFIHTSDTTNEAAMTPVSARMFDSDMFPIGYCIDPQSVTTDAEGGTLIIQFPSNAVEPDPTDITVLIDATPPTKKLHEIFDTFEWSESMKTLSCTNLKSAYYDVEFAMYGSPVKTKNNNEPLFGLKEFDLSDIDEMRELILQYTGAGAFVINESSGLYPYIAFQETVGENKDRKFSMHFSQEGLCIKTYQSDLFNNWIQTEWIDGDNGINAITAVDTAGGNFTIDQLNLAQKVYVMLNRIAISGGTYDDWLDAVYSHDRVKGIESPVYHGSLIKELAFEEVISNADTEIDGNVQPLGTLAGRGRFTQKHKGGRINIRINEPSYIIGIASITPRVDYSQGNKWDVNLKTYNDFHKPQLDAIGFQDLITEQLHWSDSTLDTSDGSVTTKSLGKQPAWINYMTNVNKVYGNFADINKEMFMTLNRRYELNEDGSLKDGTTYIDPIKYNQIFAQSSLDAQNFWMQIAVDAIARRKMSAKVIPNL